MNSPVLSPASPRSQMDIIVGQGRKIAELTAQVRRLESSLAYRMKLSKALEDENKRLNDRTNAALEKQGSST